MSQLCILFIFANGQIQMEEWYVEKELENGDTNAGMKTQIDNWSLYVISEYKIHHCMRINNNDGSYNNKYDYNNNNEYNNNNNNEHADL